MKYVSFIWVICAAAVAVCDFLVVLVKLLKAKKWTTAIVNKLPNFIYVTSDAIKHTRTCIISRPTRHCYQLFKRNFTFSILNHNQIIICESLVKIADYSMQASQTK